MVSSAVLVPTYRYPIANFQGSFIRFMPKNLKAVHFVYLKLPDAPVYGVDTSSGFNKYDPGTSMELLWNDIAIMDIIALSIQEIGISISNKELMEYSLKVQQIGV
jgi:hypothetical protein